MVVAPWDIVADQPLPDVAKCSIPDVNLLDAKILFFK